MQRQAGQSGRVIAALSEAPLVRSREIRRLGVSASTLARLVRSGRIQRVESLDGTLLGYRLPGVEVSQPNNLLPDIAARHPNAVLCLFSALRFHDMTDVTDLEFTAAVGPGANRVTSLPGVKLIHWQDPLMLRLGVDAVRVGGLAAWVTDPARTVADLYRPMLARRHESLGITDEIRNHALGVLTHREGDAGLERLVRYTTKLGWWEPLASTIGALREAVRWHATPKP